jgi:L-rhamnose-H+ transport protein
MPNPALGVFFHWLGGLASGSFYVPFRGVKSWSWETLWTVGGVFSWIAAPLAVGSFLTNDIFAVFREAPRENIFWCYFFGLLWGFGGMTRLDRSLFGAVVGHWPQASSLWLPPPWSSDM